MGAAGAAGDELTHPGSRKPRVLLLVDRPGWAYDRCARQLVHHLGGEYEFHIHYAMPAEGAPASAPTGQFDLCYQFFWGDLSARALGIDPERVIKEVSSHRWEDDAAYGPCVTPDVLVGRYLADAASVCCTSARLFNAVSPWHPHVFHAPLGIDPEQFYPTSARSGPLRVGWAGNLNDEVKGLRDVLFPACEGVTDLRVAGGDAAPASMNDFYNSVDVIAIASWHEGTPLPLLEGMAAGCFPVAADVGVVSELVRNGENGLVVRPRTAEAFKAAFAWCEANLKQVRRAGRHNADMVRSSRAWAQTAKSFGEVLADTLERAELPRFRNDDVSGDTCFDSFERFCNVFRNYGIRQTHGITLHGRTNTYPDPGNATALEGLEYPGFKTIAQLRNEEIVRLSQETRFDDRGDLIEYLNDSDDSIACHGLYHTDYSIMTEAEQLADIEAALRVLGQLFPRKPIKYFIAPFNRTNEHTFRVCRSLGLSVLADQGVHLEDKLETVTFEPGVWYRYHHHRFYPDSAFKHFNLSLAALRKCLERNVAGAGN